MPESDGLIDGIEINSIRDMSRFDSMSMLRYMEPLSDSDDARWGLLNTALFVDGLYLKITTQVATPLVILHVAAGDGAGNVAYRASSSRRLRDPVPPSLSTMWPRANTRR